MTYELHITQATERDISKAHDYIEYNLGNSSAASNLFDKTIETLHKLLLYPESLSIIDDPSIIDWQVRFIRKWQNKTYSEQCLILFSG